MTGRKPKVVYDTSMPQPYPLGAADSTRLRPVTGGWEPAVALDERVAEMTEWYWRTPGG